MSSDVTPSYDSASAGKGPPTSVGSAQGSSYSCSRAWLLGEGGRAPHPSGRARLEGGGDPRKEERWEDRA